MLYEVITPSDLLTRRPDIVAAEYLVIERAPHAIERLVNLGVPFNTEGNALHLTREGGHSHRRIVHVADATGWAVQSALLGAAQANPNITLLPGQACIDLITGRHELRYSGRITSYNVCYTKLLRVRQISNLPFAVGMHWQMWYSPENIGGNNFGMVDNNDKPFQDFTDSYNFV